MIKDTAYEGVLYRDCVKTTDSNAYVAVPSYVRKSIERWKKQCPDTRPESLLFPTFSNSRKTGTRFPQFQEFLQGAYLAYRREAWDSQEAGQFSSDASNGRN